MEDNFEKELDFCFDCESAQNNRGCEGGMCKVTANAAEDCIGFDKVDFRTHDEIARENFYGHVMQPEGY